jgi:hypothetical protein
MDPTRVAMVEFRNLGKQYGIGKASVAALVDFSLTLYQGQIMSLIGPNGMRGIVAPTDLPDPAGHISHICWRNFFCEWK